MALAQRLETDAHTQAMAVGALVQTDLRTMPVFAKYVTKEIA